MKFKIGDRVKTTVDSRSAWLNGLDAPAGTAGTIVRTFPRWNTCEVLLDGESQSLPYSKDELEAES